MANQPSRACSRRSVITCIRSVFSQIHLNASSR